MENATLTKELTPIKAKVSKINNNINCLVVKSDQDLELATDLLGGIKNVGREIKEKKENITKPLNEALRNVRAFFAPVESQWIGAERKVKMIMVDYNNFKQAEARKKIEVIEKKVEKRTMTFESAADQIESVSPKKSVEGKTGAVQFRTVREVIITDEKKLPREYLVPDMVKIRKVALAGVAISGVTVAEKQIVAGVTKQRNE